MVVNVQLAGEATWFWYATLLHQGTKLYADLHLPLQPLYTLETDGWMRIVGRKCLPFEALSLIHISALLVSMMLLLRESKWPDWRKACILFTAFFVDIYFSAIRFDDFHVVNDTFMLCSLLTLLCLYHASNARKQFLWAAATGILSGLAFMNRSTDGGTLFGAAAVCVAFLAPRRKLLSTAVFLLFAACTCLFIVHLTGDTFHDYLANSILHASAAKGGTGYVMQGPLRAVVDNVQHIVHDKRWIWCVGMVLVGELARRFWKDTSRAILTAEFLFAGVVVVASIVVKSYRHTLIDGTFIAGFNLLFQTAVYPLCFAVILHFLLARKGLVSYPWDAREILVFVPAATLFSAAVSQATGTYNSTISMVLLFLLSPIWFPVTGKFRWLTDSWIAIGMVMALTGMYYKAYAPYAWVSYSYKPMFEYRQRYDHPVYGTMYAQIDLLQFIIPICKEIEPSGPHPELLSLPYSYANYFCDTPPWHGYVQTWFDTATPATMQGLIDELETKPPQWILYQRQLKVLAAHELEYHHGQPMIHRKLDDLIVSRVTTGQWKVVDHRNYLKDDDWYLIQTRP
jgi:hypothetical protein